MSDEFDGLLDRVCADVHDVRQTAHAQEARQAIIARDAKPRQWQICNEPRKYDSSLPAWLEVTVRSTSTALCCTPVSKVAKGEVELAFLHVARR
jgi:hypothetical protein